MREAAFFDLDKTVIAKASVVAFGRPFYQQGLISRRTILRALYGQLLYLYLGADEEKIARMRASMLDLTKGWDQRRVQEIVEEALEQIVEPIIYAEALELIAHHRTAGRLVVIVSASPEEVVLPLARYLGVDEAIASRARLDGEGRYTGAMEYDAFGPAKASAMWDLAASRGLDLAASYAYSDSATDVPMLEAVGHAVAVNPDRELQRIAQDRGWEIRHFVRPVRLRDRVAVPHPGVLALVGAIFAGAVGGIVWWRLRRMTVQQDRPNHHGHSRDRGHPHGVGAPVLRATRTVAIRTRPRYVLAPRRTRRTRIRRFVVPWGGRPQRIAPAWADGRGLTLPAASWRRARRDR